MRLTTISVRNFRSIKNISRMEVNPLQALVGENNAGKSNLLRAIKCFLTAGAGGMKESDFNDSEQDAAIECEFGSLSDEERRQLRPYLLGDKVILRKELRIEFDESRGKNVVKAKYHGYQAEPRDAHLSIKKLESAATGRVNWKETAEHAGILDYVQDANGRVNKGSYVAGLKRYLKDHDVEYDEPVLGDTQALGIPQNLLSTLPEFFLLPAITDYSDEVSRRSKTSVFRRLMADLSNRILKVDPRYRELEAALGHVRLLLNQVDQDDQPARLPALSQIEESLRDVVQRLVPTVNSVRLDVTVDEFKDIFSKGVNLRVDDGVLTDVLDKGHGLQRSIVFSLLQMLIKSGNHNKIKPIILAIEEPELYIHPHSQRLIFRVLREFSGSNGDEDQASGTDQVIYSTHSPSFVEVWNYQRIGIVTKTSTEEGTTVRQAQRGVLGSPSERRAFKTLTSFSLKHNEVFFSRSAILVEGPEDEVGVIATARKLDLIGELPEEIGLSIVVTNGKGEIPKFQKVLNAFGIRYGVLLEMDGADEEHSQTAPILDELRTNKIAIIPDRIEILLGLEGHFKDQRHAKRFFSDPNNINNKMEETVRTLWPEEV